MTIPKIIHFTWKTKTLTKFAQRTWDAWKKTHPDWELRLYDDEDIRNLVAEDYPQQLAVFDRYRSGIFRADAFRFFVLHKFGGIYADLDMLPVRDISELRDRTECFVGAEPEKHVRENDAQFLGMPFVLCNAFMGSIPGHVFWQRCIERLEDCVCDDVVDATGPRFVNGIALCIDRAERPDVLLPNYWSPLAGDGRPCPTTKAYADRLEEYFRVIGRDEPTLVSHLWRNSWFMPIPYKGPNFWKIPNNLQWWWRQKSNPDIAATRFAAPSLTYADQRPQISVALPILFVAADLSTVSEADDPATVIASLQYPKENTSIGLFGGAEDLLEKVAHKLASAGFEVVTRAAGIGTAAMHNAVLEAASATDYVLIIDGRVSGVTPQLLPQMLAAGRPITTVSVRGSDGLDRNESTFLYHKYVFKHLFRNGALEGCVRPGRGRDRIPLLNAKYLRYAPLTSVGSDVILINKAVWEAGVRFAEVPYKYHTDTEGFAIAARDHGFEVCGLPNVEVVTRRPALV